MQIKIRHSTEDDCHDLLIWRNNPAIRQMCFDSSQIKEEEHKKWFDKKIKDKNTRIYIAEDAKGKKLGQVRFEVNDENKAYISVNLNPEFLGQGLGHKIIRMATDIFLNERKDINKIIAEVIEENTASQKAFEKAGYSFIEETSKNQNKVKVFSFT